MPQDNFGFRPANQVEDTFGFHPATAPSKPEEHEKFDPSKQSWLNWGLEQVARTGLPIAGMMVGGALGLPEGGIGAIPGGMAGGATGSALGNVVGNWISGKEFNPVEFGVDTALGAVPPIFGPPELEGAGLRAIGKYALGSAGRGAVEGGLISGASTPFQHYAQTGSFDAPASEYLKNTGTGAAFGGVLGGGMGAWHGHSLANPPAPEIVPPKPHVEPTAQGLDFGLQEQALPGMEMGTPAGMQTRTPFDERWPQGPSGIMARDPSVPETRWQNAGAIEGPEVGPYGITADHPQLPLEAGPGQANLFGGGEDLFGFDSPRLDIPKPPPPEVPPVVPPSDSGAGGGGTDLPKVVSFKGPDKAELARLKSLGYVPWIGHADEQGFPQLILQGADRSAQMGPPQNQAKPDASGVVSFNADDGLVIPRKDIDDKLIADFSKRGMRLVGIDPATGGGVFKRVSDDIAFDEVIPGQFAGRDSNIQAGEPTGRVAQIPTLDNGLPRTPSQIERLFGPRPDDPNSVIPPVDMGALQQFKDQTPWLGGTAPPEPSGDIGALRTQQTLGPREMDPRMAERVEAGGPRAFDFSQSPNQQGQMELPWSRGENPLPIDGDADARVASMAADRLKQPMGEMPQQKSLEEQMKDAEIARYLAGEDAIPPEGIDLSQYGPDKAGGFDPNTDIAREIDEHGNLRGSVNEGDAIASVTRDYKGELPGIMVREGMQNALDAVKDKKDGVVRVRIIKENSRAGTPAALEIHDNGSGMDLETLGYKLFEVFSSGKVDDPTATGGKGIGSASFIYGGDHFEITSVAVDGKTGKKYRITTGGTPTEILKGVPPNRVEVPMSTPTGTKIKVTMKNDHESIDARMMLDKVVAHTRNRDTQIIYDREGTSAIAGTKIENLGTNEGISTRPLTTANDKIVHMFKHKNSDITVQIPPFDRSLENDFMNVHHLNNGMYQFTKEIYTTKARGIPEHVIVNIEPKINEKHLDYPFINTREDVKDDLRNLIREAVDKKVSGPEVSRRKNRTQEIYDAMAEVPTVVPTNRPFVIFDPGERLTPKETDFLVNHPVVQAWATHFDGLIDDIIRSTGNTDWGDRLERVGLVLDPGSHGIHVPNPRTGKSTIGFNPFLRIDAMSPKDAAFAATGTGLHETAHIGTGGGAAPVWKASDFAHPRFGEFLNQLSDQIHTHGDLYDNTGHDMGFVHRLGETYGAFGPERTFESADALEHIYTGGSRSGDYSPEVQELLQLYKDSRGRPETTEDLLSRTGVKQADKQSGGEGVLPGNSGSDGGGTPPRNSGKKTLEDYLAEATAKGEKEAGLTQQWYNLTRGLTTTADLSAPMRQGLPLVATKAWWKSWVPMVKALGSEKAFQKTLSDIKNRDLFQSRYDSKAKKFIPSVADEAGMKMSDISTNLSRREEAVASNWAESGGFLNKIPGAASAYKNTFGRITRSANRAYTAYLNNLRADTFESLMKDAQKMSAQALDTGFARPGIMKQKFNQMEALELDPFQNKKLAKEIGDFINTATGRGPLKTQLPSLAGGKLGIREQSLEQNAQLLTNTLFSPRLFASRVRMLNPATYMMATPMVRKQYLKAFLTTAGAWGTVSGLAKLAGADVSMDTNSADFGKIRIGNTRLDPAAGFQQYIVAASRLLSGHTTSSGTGKDFELGQGYQAQTRGEVAQRFMTNKLHPVMKFANDVAFASKYQPFQVADRTLQMFIPLIVGDTMDIIKEDPSMFPLLAPVVAGMGTQTYGKGEAVSKFIPKENDWNFEGGELWK